MNALPNSRPIPEDLLPPNGTAESSIVCMLTHTVLASMAGTMHRALLKSFVQRLALKPWVHQSQQFFFAVVRQERGDGPEDFLVEQDVVDTVGEDDRRLDVTAWAVDQVASVNDGVVLSSIPVSTVPLKASGRSIESQNVRSELSSSIAHLALGWGHPFQTIQSIPSDMPLM